MFEAFKVFATLGLNQDEFKQGLDSAEARVRGLGDSMSSAGRSLTRNVTLPIVAIGGAAIAAGNEVDQAMNNIRLGTGATGDDLDDLVASFRAVGAGVPERLGDVSTAIADLNTRLGLTGEPLESMARQMLELARVTGDDVGTVIRDTTRLFGDWSVETEQQSETLDTLWKASQATGLGVTELASQMVQFGAPLRTLGFEFEESAIMLGKWEQEGVNANLVLAGMKQGISNVAAEAEMSGSTMGEAFARIVESIADASSEQEAFAIASNTFGVRAATDLSLAIREGRLSFEDLLQAVRESPETINAAASDTVTLGDSFAQLRNQATLALAPIGIRLIEAIQASLPMVTALLDRVANLVEWFVDLPAPVQGVIGALAGLAAAAGPILTVVGSITKGIGVLLPVLAKVGPAFTIIRTAVMLLTGPIGIIIGLVTALVAVFATDFLGIRTAVVNAWNSIGDSFRRWGDLIPVILERLRAAFADIVTRIGDVWRGLTDAISGVLASLRAAFDTNITALRDAWGAFTSWITNRVNAIGDAFRGFFAGFRDLINTVWSEALTQAQTLLSGWWENVSSFFTDLPRVMLQYGSDIMQGLIDGILGMITRARDAIENVANSVTGWFKNLLGIESPSAVFHEYGVSIGQGLADGIDEGSELAVAAVNRMGQQVLTAAETFVAAARGAFTPENIVGGVTRGATGREAQQRIRDRLQQIDAGRRGNQGGSAGSRRLRAAVQDFQTDALERELARLDHTLKETTLERGRQETATTRRFGMAVDQFTNAINQYTLADMRY